MIFKCFCVFDRSFCINKENKVNILHILIRWAQVPQMVLKIWYESKYVHITYGYLHLPGLFCIK